MMLFTTTITLAQPLWSVGSDVALVSDDRAAPQFSSGATISVPTIVPASAPKQRLQSQRSQLARSGKWKRREGFTRKNEDGREADRRLANHRLQPLGHLTAARKLSINEIATYAPADCPLDCP